MIQFARLARFFDEYLVENLIRFPHPLNGMSG
jgi:hypothetical protein